MASKKLTEAEILMKESVNHKVYCKCGSGVPFYPFECKTKKICRNCGRYIFKDKKQEFKERLREQLWKTEH